MSSMHLALQALLAPLLAYLGGVFLRRPSSPRAATPGPESVQERTLGFALWLGSLFAGGLALARILFVDTSKPIGMGSLIYSLALILVWIGAGVLGLKMPHSAQLVTAVSLATGSAAALLFVFSDSRIEWAEAVLLTGLMVWLGAKLVFAGRPPQ